MAFSVTESCAANVLLDWLLKNKSCAGSPITDSELKEAATVLAKSSYKRLSAGISVKMLEEQWRGRRR